MNAPDLVSYLDWPVDELLKQLAKVMTVIADLATDHAEARAQEIADKATGWSQSIETAVRAREKSSQFHAAAASQTRIEVEGKLDALREERDFLRFLIGVKTKELASA